MKKDLKKLLLHSTLSLENIRNSYDRITKSQIFEQDTRMLRADSLAFYYKNCESCFDALNQWTHARVRNKW